MRRMLATLRALRTPVEERERGIALITVIGIGAVITALIATAIVFTMNGTRYARDDVDSTAALAAAYGGVEEYQSRLVADPAYIRFGNPGAPFSSASGLTADPSNPALGFDNSWATMPGSDDTARYRYEVDTSQYATSGALRLRSTGLVGDETRTVVVDLRQSDFLAYLYFTDYEIQDPAQYGRPSSCVRHAYEGRSADDCGTIEFASGDVINGSVHSNDTIRACGTRFMGDVTTSYNPASGDRYQRTCGSHARFANPDPTRSNSPGFRFPLEMPETNTQIRSDALDGGCVYTGPTSIEFHSNGTMTVRSPWTKATRPGTSTPVPAACGTPGSGSGTLGQGVRIPVPAHAAIYVQNVPSVAGNPNTWPGSSKPHTCPSNGNGIGYPVSREDVPDSIDGIQAYGCRNGDIFVKGTLQGQVTLAAENYLYVVDDVRYADADRDMLGLIGNGMVWVWNPDTSDGRRNGPDSYNITIDGAILSLHSFAVQNTARSGYRGGTLSVRGSIAQSFRGVVAYRSGYDKDYVYDPRLLYQSPPHFLSPVTIEYGVSTWIETPPAINPDGSYR